MERFVFAVEPVEPADSLVDIALLTLQSFWWLWALIAILGAGKLAWRLYQWRRLAKSGIHEIDLMDGTTFERFLMTHFRRLGYRVEHTGRIGDYGADLVATRDGRRTVVQAKCWKKSVGVKAVQEAATAKPMYRCSGAIVVTNRGFTAQARKLAVANGVELWDRNVLVRQLLRSGRDVHPEPAVTSATAAYDRAECAICQVTVSEKVRQYCVTHSKRFGGRIYCFRHQRVLRSPAGS